MTVIGCDFHGFTQNQRVPKKRALIPKLAFKLQVEIKFGKRVVQQELSLSYRRLSALGGFELAR